MAEEMKDEKTVRYLIDCCVHKLPEEMQERAAHILWDEWLEYSPDKNYDDLFIPFYAGWLQINWRLMHQLHGYYWLCSAKIISHKSHNSIFIKTSE